MEISQELRLQDNDDAVEFYRHATPEVIEEAEEAVVDQMMQIVASQASGYAVANATPEISREDIRKVYRDVQGDPSRVFDDVMTLLTVRALRLEEEQQRQQRETASDGLPDEAKLQWHELCAGLGLTECHAFVQMLEGMPEVERDAALSEHGGFFQQLLLGMEKAERESQEHADLMHAMEVGEQFEREANQEDEHPLEHLQRLFPDYKINVIEDVFEAHGFDVAATASALMNIGAVNHVKSFASIVKANKPTTTWVATPHGGTDHDAASLPVVESLGHFPILPTRSKQRKPRHGGKKTEYKTLDEFSRIAGSMIPRYTNTTREHVVKQPLANAWNTQATPTGGDSNPPMESKLTTDLKIERLCRLLPSIDRDLVRTTFFLNGASSTVTEAALREIFHLPVPEPPPQPISDDDKSPVTTADAHVEDNPTYAECRARVDSCWSQLSDRYIAALQSFNRNHRVIVADRVRDIASGRRALRDAQHAAAHAFVVAHLPHIRRQQALDLHHLTVLEANHVMKEVIEVCRAERIRRCILICGVGNHSINQKARLLTSVQLSLEHRRIAFRKESGALYIYPLRSSTN